VDKTTIAPRIGVLRGAKERVHKTRGRNEGSNSDGGQLFHRSKQKSDEPRFLAIGRIGSQHWSAVSCEAQRAEGSVANRTTLCYPSRHCFFLIGVRMFATSKDYHELNAGVHRVNPKNIRAPALVWHFAFWSRPKLAREYGDPVEISKVRNSIDKLFVELCRALRGDCEVVEIFPTVANVHVLLFGSAVDHDTLHPIKEDDLSTRERDIFASSRRNIGLQFKWQGLRIAIRCEIHDEFVTFTCFAEFDETLPISANDHLNKNFTIAHEYLNAKGKDAFEVGVIREFLFREFWTLFHDYIRKFEPVQEAIETFGESFVFADFRGLILSDTVIKFADDSSAFDPNRASTWGYKAKKTLLPILKIPKGDRLRNYECAMNYLLDGRAFYMSALAPQLAEANINERIPLEYIVYAPQNLVDPDGGHQIGVNKRQLGRVVNNLHVSGTARLAALKDVRELHEASGRLARMDEVLQNAREQIAGFAPEASSNTDYVEQAHRQLNDITRYFINNANVGLLYRIERSRYYVNQFQNTTKHLRIKRLEGNQRYDEFVERRLGAEFDFIDRLGRRYERTTKSLAAVDQGYVLAQTKRTQERVAKIAEYQSDVLEQTETTQERVAQIQEWGEFALLAALIPYYLTHLLEPVIDETVRPTFVVLVWAAFLAFAAYRKFRDKDGRVEWRPIVFSAFVLVVAALLAVLMRWTPIERFRLVPQESPHLVQPESQGAGGPSDRPSTSPSDKTGSGEAPR
jgi:hypothetical protein